MGYQNVSTPRFYISWGDYWKAIGASIPARNTIRPTVTNSITLTSEGNWYRFWYPYNYPPYDSAPAGINWCAVLNHNLTEDYRFIIKQYTPDSAQSFTGAPLETDVNISPGNVRLNGFSLGTRATAWDDMGVSGVNIQTGVGTITQAPVSSDITFKIGCMVYGKYYDMPVAPDLSLSLEHDYSGIKKTTSMSGASFSNANWIKPPKWGDKEAWQLGDFPRPYSGRRVWDLSFSYISDTDLEPRNYTGTKLDDSDVPVPSDDNWFDNILHYTMGGHLPFIFQPDKDVVYNWTDEEPSHITEIPELAICRFDMNSFSGEQVAPGVYNIKVKIKESW